MINLVQITKRAEKCLKKVPKQVLVNFEVWRGQVVKSGLETVQKVPGYHDEALKGKLAGVRSVRLNDGFRVYYRIVRGMTQVVRVEEVNKHEYKKVERLFGR
jgi:toxin HigB-1